MPSGRSANNCCIEFAARELRRQLFQIDGGEIGLQPACDHRLRQPWRRPLPQRKHRRDAGAGELLLAVGADIGEEQVAEDHVGDAVAQRLARRLRPCALRRSRSGTDTGSARSAAAVQRLRIARAKFPAARRGSTPGSNVSVTVVSAPTTSNSPARRISCSANALSLPLDHEISAFGRGLTDRRFR